MLKLFRSVNELQSPPPPPALSLSLSVTHTHTHTHTHTNLYTVTVNLQLCSTTSNDHLLDDWGDWEQAGSVLLSGSATPLRPADPDMILYGGSYLRWWSGRGREGPINSWSTKMGDSDTCQTPDKHKHTHTHIQGQKSNTNRRTARYTTCQSTRNISAALSQRWHNPKSTWLKLDLSNSARTVSVTSKSFGPDWRHSATLVTVTALPRQVTGVCACARSNTLTHKRTHTIIAETSLDLFFVSSEC